VSKVAFTSHWSMRGEFHSSDDRQVGLATQEGESAFPGQVGASRQAFFAVIAAQPDRIGKGWIIVGARIEIKPVSGVREILPAELEFSL